MVFPVLIPPKNNSNIFLRVALVTEKISNNHITALFEDNQGNILIGTENGLNIYDKKAERIISLLSERITSKAA